MSGFTLQRPAALANGKLELPDGESGVLEYIGTLDRSIFDYVYLTYVGNPDRNSGEREAFTIRVERWQLDNNGQFNQQIDLSWSRSTTFTLANITATLPVTSEQQTNSYRWDLNQNQAEWQAFISATGIDPNDPNLSGFELINNRSDRTRPKASLDIPEISNGRLNIDKGATTIKLEGFLQDLRDDGLPGSGSPQLHLRWSAADGSHRSDSPFLRIHQPHIWSSPQWESSSWASGADAQGRVGIDEWSQANFRWAMPGTWVIDYAGLTDEAFREERDNNSWWWWQLGDERSYAPSDYNLNWNQSGNANPDQSAIERFKRQHGINLNALGFEIVNSTPDITPPKLISLERPGALSDGILDLQAGENYVFSGQTEDRGETAGANGASGLESITIELIRTGDIGAPNTIDPNNTNRDSDVIELRAGRWQNSTTLNGRLANFNPDPNQLRYRYKTGGEYRFWRAWLRDEAGNEYYYTANQSSDISSSEAQEFKRLSGINPSDQAFNFTLLNPHPDSTPPQINLTTPSALANDKTLDIAGGESGILELRGTIVDTDNNGSAQFGSGFQNFNFTLEDVSTAKQYYVYLSPQDLDANGNFSKSIDFSNAAPGSFKVRWAALSDNAGNTINYAQDWWDAGLRKLELKQAGFDIDSWEFTIKNNSYDNQVPRGNIEIPSQLQDGTLDISGGESPDLVYSGQISDGQGSGLSYMGIELVNTTTEKSIRLDIDSSLLDANGNFSINYDASWDTGNYHIKSAYLRDRADNEASVWSEQGLSSTQIQRFQQATGIDLSSKAFNFQVNNVNADSSAPELRNWAVDGLTNGRLVVGAGGSNQVAIRGEVIDKPAGLRNLWLMLRESNSGKEINQYITGDDLYNETNFKLELDFTYLPGGNWELAALDTDDWAGNRLSYWKQPGQSNPSDWELKQRQKLIDAGLDIDQLSFSVANNTADTEAPLLSNLSLRADPVTGKLRFSGDVSDVGSGFEALWLEIQDPSAPESSDRSIWLDVGYWNMDWANDEEQTRRKGSFSVSTDLQRAPSGNYTIVSAGLSDRAENRINYWQWDHDATTARQRLSNRGLDINQLSFSWNNPNPDLELPVISSLQLNQSGTINAGANPILTITGSISDGSGSGFDYMEIVLRHSTGAERSIHLNADSDELDSSGNFRIVENFGKAANGSWSVKQAFLRDRAGNQAAYFRGSWDAQREKERFMSSGIDLDQFNFDVVNTAAPDTTLPLVTVVDRFTRVNNSLVFSGRVDDGIDGSGLDTLQISLYNFTIKEWLQFNIDASDLQSDGRFSINVDYPFFTESEWRIENVYLTDQAGNSANYWRGSWDATRESNRLRDRLENFQLDQLITFNQLSQSLVPGATLRTPQQIFKAGEGLSALEDSEEFSEGLAGLASSLADNESVASELVSFVADVSNLNGNARIYRFELNLPGDPTALSIKKQRASQSVFDDFKQVFIDSNGEEGLTVEEGQAVLYVRDNGIYDHDSRLGWILDPFVITRPSEAPSQLLLPRPAPKPNDVLARQNADQLEAEASNASNTEDDTNTPSTTSPTIGGAGGGGGGSSPPPATRTTAAPIDNTPSTTAPGTSTDEITGARTTVVTAGAGPSTLEGTPGPTAFTFSNLDGFSKKQADRIIGFNANEGDRLLFSTSALPDGVDQIRFKAAKSGSQIRKSFNSNKTFIYDRRDGDLFVNANGRAAGLGEGGLLAILQGAPKLSANQLELVDITA